MSEQNTPSPEATPEAAPEAPQHSPTVSSALQLLMSKESAIREQSEALSAREESVKRGMELQAMAEKDPYALMKELGVDYNKLTDRVLSDPEFNPMRGVEAKLSALQERLTAQDKAKEDSQKAAAHEEVRSSIRTYVDGSEEYPLIQKAGMQDAVYERVQQSIRSGQPVSEATAASEVEQQLSGIINRVLDDKELRRKLLGEPEPQAPGSLTNDFSQTVSSKNSPPSPSGDNRVDAFAALLNFTE